MHKIIFGIFAHPDDEAFGPSGALLKAVHEGAELHLVTLTSGDGGMNPDNVANLGETRLKEWKEAGKLLGAKTMHHLGYKDGQLNNLAMIEIGATLCTTISDILKDVPKDSEVEFMTLDLNGLTGHIDHIVAARATCFAFYELKKKDARLTRILFSCLTRTHYPTPDTSWIFREAGRSASEIDETVDARQYRDEIIAIARCHTTQRKDCEYFLKTAGDSLGINTFTVRT